MTIPNVGPYFAFALMATSGNVNRFENARQMQAYLDLDQVTQALVAQLF